MATLFYKFSLFLLHNDIWVKKKGIQCLFLFLFCFATVTESIPQLQFHVLDCKPGEVEANQTDAQQLKQWQLLWDSYQKVEWFITITSPYIHIWAYQTNKAWWWFKQKKSFLKPKFQGMATTKEKLKLRFNFIFRVIVLSTLLWALFEISILDNSVMNSKVKRLFFWSI